MELLNTTFDNLMGGGLKIPSFFLESTMFLLFAYDEFVSGGWRTVGGWDDFRGAFSSLEDAKKGIPSAHQFDHYQIVDLNTLRIVDAR